MNDCGGLYMLMLMLTNTKTFCNNFRLAALKSEGDSNDDYDDHIMFIRVRRLAKY